MFIAQLFTESGIDTDALALRLQDEGAKSFVKSWHQLLESIAEKDKSLADVS